MKKRDILIELGWRSDPADGSVPDVIVRSGAETLLSEWGDAQSYCATCEVEGKAGKSSADRAALVLSIARAVYLSGGSPKAAVRACAKAFEALGLAMPKVEELEAFEALGLAMPKVEELEAFVWVRKHKVVQSIVLKYSMKSPSI